MYVGYQCCRAQYRLSFVGHTCTMVAIYQHRLTYIYIYIYTCASSAHKKTILLQEEKSQFLPQSNIYAGVRLSILTCLL